MFIPLHQILQKQTQKRRIEPLVQASQIIAVFHELLDEVCDPEIRKGILFCFVKNNILSVRCSHPAYANEILWYQDTLLRKLNDRLNHRWSTSIRIEKIRFVT